MKKLYISVALAAACVLSASAKSKLDASGQVAISQYRQSLLYSPEQVAKVGDLPFELQTNSRSEASASVFIELADGVTADDIAACGFDIKTQIENIVIANATLSDIEALAESDLVKAMSFSKKADAYLDIARLVTGVDAIHQGSDGLPKAYTGKGVIAGIFDVGVDPNHIAFRGDDPDNLRVKRVWHFTSTDGSYVTYDTQKGIKGFTTDNTGDFHGTHTLGCMAGSFNGRPGKVATYNGNYTVVKATERNPFYGSAPGSDIAAGCGALYDDNIVMAVQNCVDYAKEVNKPVVVNLSLGSNVGPHDGTDLVARSLEALGKEAIICIAAGNEGDVNNTIAKTLTASDNKLNTLLYYINGAPGVMDVWASDSKPFKVTPVIYDLNTDEILFEYPVEGELPTTYITSSYYTVSDYLHYEIFDMTFNRSALIISAGVEPTNNRYRFYMNYDLSNNTYYNKDGNRTIGLLIEGTPGQRIDIVNKSDYSLLSSFDKKGFTDGTPELSISSTACSEKLLTVGAWNTREYWGVLSGSAYGYNAGPSGESMLPYGKIASYSSYGTTIDGRTYPLVCAPGSGIVSAISTHYFNNPRGDYRGYENSAVASYIDAEGTTYIWDVCQGTSMATPIVAGAIATWLEADPSLTTEDVIAIIRETSDNDQYTAVTPERWGAGKFNALAGLKKVIGASAIKDVLTDNSKNVLISAHSLNRWDIFVAGASKVDAKLYTVSGALAAEVSCNGESAVLDATSLPKGIYVLSINGVKSQRILVK